MTASSVEQAMSRKSLIPPMTLAWYAVLFLALAMAPLDTRIWWGSNILPLAFVTVLVLTHRAFPLSSTSYLLITAWLTLHTVAVHYTYPKVPLGFWLDRWFDFHRNHFDRIVHFSFGFFMTLPLVEVFRRRCNVKGWLLPYLVVMTVLGFSAFWEIVEAWIGQIAHPDIEQAMVGHQGDVWDPQRDMASAFYGSLLSVGYLAWRRMLHGETGESSSCPSESGGLLEAAQPMSRPVSEQAPIA
jgi:putative membrane protein